MSVTCFFARSIDALRQVDPAAYTLGDRAMVLDGLTLRVYVLTDGGPLWESPPTTVSAAFGGGVYYWKQVNFTALHLRRIDTIAPDATLLLTHASDPLGLRFVHMLPHLYVGVDAGYTINYNAAGLSSGTWTKISGVGEYDGSSYTIGNAYTISLHQNITDPLEYPEGNQYEIIFSSVFVSLDHNKMVVSCSSYDGSPLRYFLALYTRNPADDTWVYRGEFTASPTTTARSVYAMGTDYMITKTVTGDYTLSVYKWNPTTEKYEFVHNFTATEWSGTSWPSHGVFLADDSVVFHTSAQSGTRVISFARSGDTFTKVQALTLPSTMTGYPAIMRNENYITVCAQSTSTNTYNIDYDANGNMTLQPTQARINALRVIPVAPSDPDSTQMLFCRTASLAPETRASKTGTFTASADTTLQGGPIWGKFGLFGRTSYLALYLYNPSTNTWTRLEDIPEAEGYLLPGTSTNYNGPSLIRHYAYKIGNSIYFLVMDYYHETPPGYISHGRVLVYKLEIFPYATTVLQGRIKWATKGGTSSTVTTATIPANTEIRCLVSTSVSSNYHTWNGTGWVLHNENDIETACTLAEMEANISSFHNFHEQDANQDNWVYVRFALISLDGVSRPTITSSFTVREYYQSGTLTYPAGFLLSNFEIRHLSDKETSIKNISAQPWTVQAEVFLPG